MNGNVHVMDHPLVAHKLTILRDKNTSVKDFRELVSEIGMLITYEATRDLPLTEREVDILIVDPMLATGGSADAAIGFIKEYGCTNIKLMVLLAAPEGIERIQKNHPVEYIYCGALDGNLKEKGYIVPGLGDAGDRIFGTK